jgi:cobalt/nickel transport system permease protein
LRSTAGRAAEVAETTASALRPLWLGLGALLILTPLGILATGSAWGEWMARDYADPAARHEIAASSFQQVAPLHAPEGLARLSQIWTAPFARYAPPYIRSQSFGYFLSAMFGAGLIVLSCVIVARLFGTNRTWHPASAEPAGVEKSLDTARKSACPTAKEPAT